MSVKLEEAQVVQHGKLNLRDALYGLSKDALTVIRKNLSVKNASKLNRDHLIDALVELLPQRLTDELLSLLLLMDEERVACLEQATKKNGVLVINEEWNELKTKYWQDLALLFSEEHGQRKAMVMPVEFIDIVKDALTKLDRKRITLNTTYLQAVKGMVYFYGVLAHDELVDISSRYPMFEQLSVPFMHLIINYRHYYADFGLDETYIHHAAIPNPTLIVTEQNKREGMSYASFTLLQLQEASQAGYIMRTEGHRLLVDMLMKQFKLPQLEATLVADQSEFAIRAGLQLQDLLQYIGNKIQFDEASLQLLLPRLIIMYNHTPQWCLKGHYSAQLTKDNDSAPSQPVKEEITGLGRNDICYCGSGKKYKKCCMNK